MPELFRLGVPLGKLGKPEDVASAIAYLASEEAHHITGAILNVDGMAQLTLRSGGRSDGWLTTGRY